MVTDMDLLQIEGFLFVFFFCCFFVVFFFFFFCGGVGGWGVDKQVTYRRTTENSTDDKDVTRTLGTRYLRLRITRGYTSMTTRSVVETLPPMGLQSLRTFADGV